MGVRNTADAGFSVVEVVVSFALILTALTWSVNIIIATGHARMRLSERTNLIRALDDLLDNLRAVTAYESEAGRGVIRNLPRAFHLKVSNMATEAACTTTNAPDDFFSVTIACSSS